MALSAQERKWQAESDANTLAEAKVIQGDKKRLAQAAKAGKQIAKELTKRATAMNSVKSKGVKKTTPKKTVRKRKK
jgi:hypothetical protein